MSALMQWLRRSSFPPSRGCRLRRATDDYRLTDCVHELIRSGLRVESYRLYDQDEVQGINSAADLARAEFIMQKRLFRPRRQEEQNLVTFGTGGWRAIIGEGFTMQNVRRLSQALANEITRQGHESQGVIIGYDRRFLSRQAAEASAEVFAGNNIPTVLLDEDAPTPLITYATAIRGLGLRPRLHRQPQSARMERPQSIPRRRIAAAGPRNPADRRRDQSLDGERCHQAGARHRPRRGHRGTRRFHQRLRGRGGEADRSGSDPQSRAQSDRRSRCMEWASLRWARC